MFFSNRADMEQAIATAKSEVEIFITALQNPQPSQTYFSIKKPFAYEEEGVKSYEHIWLDQVSWDGEFFHGNIANEPLNTKEVSLGQKIKIKKDDISDWMIIDGGILKGGYTIRALRSRMSDKEKKDFDASVDFKFQ